MRKTEQMGFSGRWDRGRKTSVGVLLIGISFVIPIIHCSHELNGDKEMVGVSDIGYKDAAEVSWTELSGRRVFFGHQSVGADIIHGITHLKEETESIDFDIKESRTPINTQRGILVHARIGRNQSPESKIDDFMEILTGEMGETIDICMMKLCYVDITAATNLDRLVEYYAEAIAQLRAKRPNLTVVHCTVPLTVRESTAKGIVKRVLGKSTMDDANVRRSLYNQRLHQRFGHLDPVFDIASWEASYEDGAFEAFQSEGEGYPALRPDFTDDGGHLNELGKRRLAIGFLQSLAEIPSKAVSR